VLYNFEWKDCINILFGMWNEAVVAYFKVLRQNFLEELKKTTNNFRLNGIPAEN